MVAAEKDRQEQRKWDPFGNYFGKIGPILEQWPKE